MSPQLRRYSSEYFDFPSGTAPRSCKRTGAAGKGDEIVRTLAALTALLSATAILAGTAAAAEPVITDIKPFELHPGINTVPGFGVNGETFTIVQAWRGNGNAHGYDVWLVLSPEAEGQKFGVTGQEIQGEVLPRDIIRDEPFDGERWEGSIRFARAKVDGVPRTILIDAQLGYDGGRPFADHETATIRIFQLSRSDDGGQPDIFNQISERKTAKRYCNVEYAVRDVLHIPVDDSIRGKDGCG